MNPEKSVLRIGEETPVKKFETFPLANNSVISDDGDTAIPTTEDVQFVKEFTDENEK
ncbi:MAG: hypothetical protein J6S45_06715 [Firmicutes bacterium]|nr:hypothetical protein [Bacillota bacterium]